MSQPLLVWDVIYKVLDECVATELNQSERLLDHVLRRHCWIPELLVVHRHCRDYLLGNAAFHRLRLWRMLGKTVGQRESVPIAVQHDKDWTMLDLKLTSQQRTSTEDVCIFVAVEVRPPKQGRWQHVNNNKYPGVQREGWVVSVRQKKIPLFSYDQCKRDMEAFAALNSASIWVWRSPSNPWLYRHINTYRMVLDNLEKELLVWSNHHRKRHYQPRRRPFERLSIDEQILHHNVELFANLATTTALQQ
ncbi:hypothetical protein K492DRAFT_206735 [Lichtheimia hyalospora FSU 10163]|nr:hypothetical protein K492DRAFT_206735 [Lichtheimia hyalospora FSU 10163]